MLQTDTHTNQLPHSFGACILSHNHERFAYFVASMVEMSLRTPWHMKQLLVHSRNTGGEPELNCDNSYIASSAGDVCSTALRPQITCSIGTLVSSVLCLCQLILLSQNSSTVRQAIGCF